MRTITRKAGVRIALAFAAVAVTTGAPTLAADRKAKSKKPDAQPNQVTITPLVEAKVPVVQAQPIPVTPENLTADRRPNGSLWNSSGRSLVEDLRAHRVGDVITIIVQESTSASSTASTKSDKSDAASFGGGTGFLRRFLKDFGASASASNSGNGATTRAGSLSARLTVVVKEVLANGNMVVEGAQSITINKEVQKVMITGMVRPQDVAQDNTIFSPQLANAAIQYDGKGTVGDRQRKGIISRIFDLIF